MVSGSAASALDQSRRETQKTEIESASAEVLIALSAA
jgi:hypothetical protein